MWDSMLRRMNVLLWWLLRRVDDSLCRKTTRRPVRLVTLSKLSPSELEATIQELISKSTSPQTPTISGKELALSHLSALKNSRPTEANTPPSHGAVYQSAYVPSGTTPGCLLWTEEPLVRSTPCPLDTPWPQSEGDAMLMNPKPGYQG